MTTSESETLRHLLPDWASSEEWSITRVDGGLSNANWKIANNSSSYFIKQFRPGSEKFIDREQSRLAHEQAHAMGISPKLVLMDQDSQLEISEFLDEYRASRSVDFLRDDFLSHTVELYRRFNASTSLPRTKHIFDMTDEHLEQGKELDVLLPSDFEVLKEAYENAKSAFFASGLDLVPCHNDPMPGNFMVKMNKQTDTIDDMKLIDFEFASNNERAYELGVFLGEVFVDEERSNSLIEDFYGQHRPDIEARVWVARAVADFKWGSWAVQQRKISGWDFDYQKYGLWKYARARHLFNDSRWSTWLARL